jgi:septal ring factor EnvC (AmiA/AmiB activator)
MLSMAYLADEAKNKKLQEQLNKMKEKHAIMEAEIVTRKAELARSQEQLAAALARIEISSAAAVSEVNKIMSEKVNEAYKEGQRDAQRFLKEMRSFFP